MYSRKFWRVLSKYLSKLMVYITQNYTHQNSNFTYTHKISHYYKNPHPNFFDWKIAWMWLHHTLVLYTCYVRTYMYTYCDKSSLHCTCTYMYNYTLHCTYTTSLNDPIFPGSPILPNTHSTFLTASDPFLPFPVPWSQSCQSTQRPVRGRWRRRER